MSNAFETYADSAKPVWRERQERATAKRAETIQRKKTALDKAMDEEARLLKRFRAIQRDQLQALLDGPYGKDVRGLRSFMRTMVPSSASALLKLVKEADWIAALETGDRLIVSEMVQHGIQLMLNRHDLKMSGETIPFGGGEDEPMPCHQAIREHIKSLPLAGAIR